MKPALAFRQPHSPASWSELPNGDLILAEINQLLAPWWPKFFGYHLLKLGALSSFVDSQTCPIKHHVALLEHQKTVNDNNVAVFAEIDDLPFLEHSVDVCLLSHALEFSLDPHHVIREANRALIPNGYLVISGYNPFSLAGLNSFIPFRRQHSPWSERFFSAMRVKDWLHLMGYEILMDEKCLHSTLANNISQGFISRHWRKFAQRFFPNFGSVYVIVAKKRVLPLTPIKPKWKLRTQLNPVNVSTLNSSRQQKKCK
ncbi:MULTISPECIES: class I SAM-dependent methyltransferase [Thalassotalea]|uniref:Class I SAM-dependent methyltransferase n=1 Tax=Thalassotalea castellviae TaxID=3075612 RepID=A0ABU3A5U2_9GAMM|nr:class I SAM-dependent methyltransferase [Thalassotalea sp. W431]MDT0605280.1 class I SAM-dependent methyltransferase [Thalassotalea sp. W431]